MSKALVLLLWATLKFNSNDLHIDVNYAELNMVPSIIILYTPTVDISTSSKCTQNERLTTSEGALPMSSMMTHLPAATAC